MFCAARLLSRWCPSVQGFSIMDSIRAAEEVFGHNIPDYVYALRPGDTHILGAENSRACKKLGCVPLLT